MQAVLGYATKHKHMDFQFITVRLLPSHYCSYHHGTALLVLVPYHLAVDFRTGSFGFPLFFLGNRRGSLFVFEVQLRWGEGGVLLFISLCLGEPNSEQAHQTQLTRSGLKPCHNLIGLV